MLGQAPYAYSPEGKKAADAYLGGNYQTALRLAKAAADQGKADAQWLLATFYLTNKEATSKIDRQVVLTLFRQSTEQGFAPAQEDLAETLARSGELEEAIKWWRLASNAGVARAQYHLGALYQHGLSVKEDLPEAFRLTKLAAEQDYADAIYDLAFMYQNGMGNKKNFTEAARLYRILAEKGVGDAQCNLGTLYHNGEGVMQDYQEAVKWFSKAAENGNSLCQRYLAVMYAAGSGTNRDPVQAHIWANLASAQGDTEASEFLDNLTQVMAATDVLRAQHLAKDTNARIQKQKERSRVTK